MSARVSDYYLSRVIAGAFYLGREGVEDVTLDLRDARAEFTRLQSINEGLEGQVKAGAHMIEDQAQVVRQEKEEVARLTKHIADRAKAYRIELDALKSERNAAWKAGMLAAAEIAEREVAEVPSADWSKYFCGLGEGRNDCAKTIATLVRAAAERGTP